MKNNVKSNLIVASVFLSGIAFATALPSFTGGDVAQANEAALFCNPTTKNPLKGFIDPLDGKGRYSGGHSSPQQFADDLGISIGTEFKAMRSGKVTKVIQNHADLSPNKDGSKSNQFNANIIEIEHDRDVKCNGKYYRSLYVHVKQNSVKVNVGDRVSQGQVLGQTGHNGWSTGPHLHVEVNQSTGSEWYKRQTVPYVWTNRRNG